MGPVRASHRQPLSWGGSGGPAGTGSTVPGAGVTPGWGFVGDCPIVQYACTCAQRPPPAPSSLRDSPAKLNLKVRGVSPVGDRLVPTRVTKGPGGGEACDRGARNVQSDAGAGRTGHGPTAQRAFPLHLGQRAWNPAAPENHLGEGFGSALPSPLTPQQIRAG